MAVSVYNPSNAREYIGLAADAKPTSNGAVIGPKCGDRFIETDTGKVYVFDGAAWSAAITGAVFTAGA